MRPTGPTLVTARRGGRTFCLIAEEPDSTFIIHSITLVTLDAPRVFDHCYPDHEKQKLHLHASFDGLVKISGIAFPMGRRRSRNLMTTNCCRLSLLGLPLQ